MLEAGHLLLWVNTGFGKLHRRLQASDAERVECSDVACSGRIQPTDHGLTTFGVRSVDDAH